MPQSRRTKPGRGAVLDATHPWARGLLGFYPLNDGSGRIAADSGPARLNLSAYSATTPVAWTAGMPGMAAACPSASQGLYATMPAALKLGWPISFAVCMQRTGTPAAFANIWSAQYNIGGTSPYFAWSMTYGTASNYIRLSYNSAATYVQDNTVYAPPLNTPIVLSATIAGTYQNSYANGVAIGTSAATAAAPTYSATACLAIGDTTGNAPATESYWAAWWSRALAPSEHAAIGAGANAIWPIFRPGIPAPVGPSRLSVYMPASLSLGAGGPFGSPQFNL